MTLQDGLNLARFNSEPPNLHLIVDAAKEIEIAIWPPPDEVSGLVEAASGRARKGRQQNARQSTREN